MALIQLDVELSLVSLFLLDLTAGITHCCSVAAQESSLTAGVNRHFLDVDSLKTCILVRDFSTIIIHPCDYFILTEKYLVIIH